MRKKGWRRLCAVGLCVAMSVSLAACGGSGKKSSPGGSQTQQQENTKKDQTDSSLAYTATEMKLPAGVEGDSLGQSPMILVGDKLVTMGYAQVKGSEAVAMARIEIPIDGKGEGSAKIVESDPSQMFSLTAVDEKGGFYAVNTVYQGGQESAAAEATSAEEALSAAEQTQAIEREELVHYTAGGKRDMDVTLAEHPDESYSVMTLAAGGGKVLVADSNGVNLYDGESGKKEKKVADASENDSAMFTLLADGTPVKSEYGEKIVVSEAGKKSVRTQVSSDILDNTVLPGEGKTFYMYSQNNLYRYTLGEDKGEKVLNFMGSNLTVSSIGALCELGDGKLAMLVSGDDGAYTLYEMAPAKSQEKRTTLTMGGYGIDSGLRAQVTKFNRESGKYRVVVDDYSEGESSVDDAQESKGRQKLDRDIASGEGPDILVLNEAMPLRGYVSKNVLEDLTPYMKKDGMLDKEKYFTNILKDGEVNGKYYYLTPGFRIWAVAGKKADLGDGQITLSDVEQLAAQKKVELGNIFGPLTRQSLMTVAMTMSAGRYVDWEKKTCSFDSPGFLALLKFAGKFPKGDENSSVDEDTSDWVRRGKSLFQLSPITNIDDYQMLLQGTIGEETTLTGFPGEKGEECRPEYEAMVQLAISSSCVDKDGAWKVLSSFMDKDFQESLNGYGSTNAIPVLRSAYEKKVSQIEKGVDANGNQMISSFPVGNTSVESKPLTKEETKAFTQIVESLSESVCEDEKILSIVSEEVDAYLSGQKSAEDVAKVIQSRVKIYISENS